MRVYLVLASILIGCGIAADNRSNEQKWLSFSAEERIAALQGAGEGSNFAPAVEAADKIFRGEKVGDASAAKAVHMMMELSQKDLAMATTIYTLGANDPDPKVQEAARAARAGALGRQVTAFRRAGRAMIFTPDPTVEASMVHWCKNANNVGSCALDGSPYDSVSVTLSDQSGKDSFLQKLEEFCPANSCLFRSIAFTLEETVETIRYSEVADDDDPMGFKP